MRQLMALLTLLAATPAQEIPVTRTWGALGAGPEYDLGDGRTVKLGIDATTVPRGGAVVVYALVQGPPAPGGGCPVRFAIRRDGRRESGLRAEILERAGTTKGPRVHLRSVGIGAHRDVEVEVRDARGRRLATTVIVRGKGVETGWFGLRFPEAAHALKQEDGSLPSLRARLDTVARLPRFDPERPLPAHAGSGVSSRPHAPDDPLPVLIPRNPSLDLRLSWQGDRLRVQSRRAIGLSPVFARLLVRLHHKGKVLTPTGKELASMSHSGRAPSAKRFDFELEIDTTKLGIRRDDRLEIEVLHCPDGSILADGREAKMMAVEDGGARVPVRSNRVRWRWPPR